jgi:ribosome recycling factor
MDYQKEFSEKTKQILADFKEELLGFRTNRPSAKLVENVKVEYSGTVLSVNQLGSINIEPPRDIIVSVWDKSAIAPMVKAIESANLGLSVQSDSTGLRIKFPELTEERRRELQKAIKASAEEVRIKMRMARDEINKAISKEADENAKFKAKEGLQKEVDSFNKSVDELVENKMKDL